MVSLGGVEQLGDLLDAGLEVGAALGGPASDLGGLAVAEYVVGVADGAFVPALFAPGLGVLGALRRKLLARRFGTAELQDRVREGVVVGRRVVVTVLGQCLICSTPRGWGPR